MSLPIRLTVVAGDRSGPFFQDFGVPFPYFLKYNLVQPIAVDMVTIDAIQSADIVQFQRQYAPESLIILRQAKDAGIPTIAHVDDNVWEIPEHNPAKAVYKGPTLDRFFYILHEADAITTSTPYLGKICLKYNKNVHLFRNLMDTSMVKFLTEGRDNPDQIRIGWTTTPHHFDDFPIAEPALKVILGKYPNVKLIFMGWLPAFIQQVPFDRFEYYEFVDSDAFYFSFANLDFDIGIAPLIESGFNHAKTARKAQEYATFKIPMCLANVSTYRDWKHGDTCIKPADNSTAGWIRALEWMIEHPKERKKIAERAYEQAARQHDINKYIWERAATYYKVYKQVVGQDHPYYPYIANGLMNLELPISEEKTYERQNA
jgi:glycosyltransferase involved in cell wall biosynthesis